MRTRTLRTRLMVGLLLLTAIGLGVSAAASVVALRSHLFNQTDSQLRAAQSLVSTRGTALLSGAAPALSREGIQRAVAPTDYVVELRLGNGTVLRTAGNIAPQLPPQPFMEIIPGLNSRIADGAPFTFRYGRNRFRVLGGTVPGTDVTDIVATSLQPVAVTTTRLVVVETVAAAAVLALTGMSAWLLLGRGLRPLHDVTRTAAAIAEGDLSRRVPDYSQYRETGQLSEAINTMLGQIQTSFDERVRSQERLQRFVADASHELRTPLTSIGGYVDLLRQGIVPPSGVEDALRRVHEETRRMGALVDNMLYLAHLDEERPLVRAKVDLAALVRDAVSDAAAVEPDRLVALRCPKSCPVVGDSDALRQVIGNVLSNVRVHTPVTAAVTVTVTSADRAAVLEIHDEGPGMAPDVVERIFDRFYRGSGGRDRKRGGNGLGMSIVAAVAAAHGGTAEAASRPGAGTTIQITLPILEPGVPELRRRRPHVGDGSPEAIRR